MFKWDARGGFRRVVPSPEPMDIMELDAIKLLIREGYVPITVGGGGVPVVMNGEARGVLMPSSTRTWQARYWLILLTRITY